MVVSGQLHSPASLLPGEIPLGRTHLRENWVGPRTFLGALENLLLLQGMEPRFLVCTTCSLGCVLIAI